MLGHYSKMGKKHCAGPLQLNRQRNTEPAHLNMILDLVSASLVLSSFAEEHSKLKVKIICNTVELVDKIPTYVCRLDVVFQKKFNIS